jgi:hypothetical protein
MWLEDERVNGKPQGNIFYYAALLGAPDVFGFCKF